MLLPCSERPAMDEARLKDAINKATCELARSKHLPDSTDLSDLIADSLDLMRMIVAIETALGVSIDDGTIMNLDVSSEDNMLQELQKIMVA